MTDPFDPFDPAHDERLAVELDDLITAAAAGDPDAEARLADMATRADHFERLLAAVVGRVGPVEITMTEYTNARTADLRPVKFEDVAATEATEPTVTYAMVEQLADLCGLATAAPRVEQALLATAGQDVARQAEAVLRAIGLPAVRVGG